MRIGELAQAAGVEVETIRYYEKEGLMPEPARTNAGYRHYQPEHLEALRFIRHCRSLDMSLAEIRLLGELTHAPAMSCTAVNELIDEHLQRVAQQIESLQGLQGQLQELRRACESGRASADCGILRSLLSAAQGEDCACHHESAEKEKH